MGVKERQREKKKTEEPVKDVAEPSAVKEQTTASGDSAHIPEIVIKVDERPNATDTIEAAVVEPEQMMDTETAAVTEIVPRWGNIGEAEWMYNIPTRSQDLHLWTEEWGDFLLEWTEFEKIHVLSISAFISRPPFKDILGKVKAFRSIGNSLVGKDVAVWLDGNNEQLRVYWRPLGEWADSIYRWALDTGILRLDVKSLVIQEAEQDFSKLPEEDIHKIMALLVERGFAEWVDKKAGAIVVNV
ncbi:MAG: hypothetical protein KAW94_02985 [Candidatus Thorarchaeota archaeon]|nr:hypothetical protein [Candidatus Thorarchaeota archaeon]